MNQVILSHFQAEKLLETRKAGSTTAVISTDLGLSTLSVELTEYGVNLKPDLTLGWEVVHSIAGSPSSCFVIQAGEAQPIQFFSEETGRVYSLYPTAGAPSMLVSGIPMHRIKDTDPHQDTLEKIRAVRPVVGQVLDTATGLGYTAIQVARTAGHVTTIELDPVVLNVCQLNPWSQELFNNSRITQLIGDSFDVVMEMESNRFTRVIHDPPAFSLAGDLYSGEFYRQLYRILKNTGRLFHYIGDLESSSGQRVTRGVARRLDEAGFKNITRRQDAFGLVASK